MNKARFVVPPPPPPHPPPFQIQREDSSHQSANDSAESFLSSLGSSLIYDYNPPQPKRQRTNEDSELIDNLRELPNDYINNIFLQILQDPVLQDIDISTAQNFTEYQAKKIISLEKGETFTIHIRKATGEVVDAVVTPQTTLKELKGELKAIYSDIEGPAMGYRKISWKYVWKNYCLGWNNSKLLDNDKKLTDYGLSDGDVLVYVRYKVD